MAKRTPPSAVPAPPSGGHRVASSVASLEPFLAMEVLERALQLEAAGREIVHLEVGEPGFPPPPAAVEACARALREGETTYTDSRGLWPLREAIAADLERRGEVAIDPERVLVTSGSSPAMLMVFSLLLEPGDEVIVPEPAYPCVPNFVRYCGATPVPVETRAEDGYAIDVDAVAARVSPRTRAIAVASPCNPTGAVQSAETMRRLAALGPTLVSDEIYDELLHDGVRTTSALAVADEPFVLDGFSKRYAMTGFRLGYVVAPPWALPALRVMQQNFFISANAFVQRAGLAALADGAETVETIRSTCERRSGRLIGGLRALGFGIARAPEGAFYVLADASSVPGIGGTALARDSKALAFALLEEAGVGAAPGIDFGRAGEGRLRFCNAVSDAAIDSALARMAEALPGLAAGSHGHGTASRSVGGGLRS